MRAMILNNPSVLEPGNVDKPVAEDGNVWAQVYSPDFLASAMWDVFGPDRGWLGHVQTPRGFMVTSITAESVAGVWRDNLGVEHVRVYRIRFAELST